ncbi:MAG: alkaline phosphatase [Spirosomaceae bacterium]|nr:alkaline phosphatase [Spirosomataceae bacterium]
MRLPFLLLFLISIQLHAQRVACHSHNDYVHPVPFWMAYSAGAKSIEADVFLVNDDLVVAHTAREIEATKTFRKLYLEPINGLLSNSFDSFDELQLLVDVKTEPQTTLNKIIQEFNQFPLILRKIQESNHKFRIVISGNRPKDYGNYPDFILFDHQQLEDLEKINLAKVGLVSFSFQKFSKWNGKGRIIDAEMKVLQDVIKKVHSLAKPVRFWATPDSKTTWFSLAQMGVDFVNTDNPFGCISYLNSLDSNLVAVDFGQIPQNTLPKVKSSPQNIILMIGDGNGLAQISAGYLANGQRLNMARIKNVGFISTQSADDFTTDSAAGGTALATGKKTKNRYVGLDPSGQTLNNIFEILNTQKGYNTGIVTTDELTGATPASFYGHTNDRGNIQDLKKDFLKSSVNVFASGGSARFDSLDWVKNERKMLKSIGEIGSANGNRIGCMEATKDMPYITQKRGDFLPQATQQTLDYLTKKKKPFMLIVENSHIDNAGHDNFAQGVVSEEIDFDQAIGVAMRYVDLHPKTLLVITADHETGGVTIPHGTKNQMELQFHSDDHSGILVPIFAYGRGADLFSGIDDNTSVFKKILHLLKIKE